MSYTEHKFGYAREDTFGSNDPNLNAAGDIAYEFGAVSPESTWRIITNLNKRATGYNVKEVPAGKVFKGPRVFKGMLGLTMQNGVLLQTAIGKSTTAGTVHTIVPHTDGSLIDSFTVQLERSGTATDWPMQFAGWEIDSLTLSHDSQNLNELMARVDWLARTGVDPGFMLDADPALPVTATPVSYPEPAITWDINGTPITVDGVIQTEATIHNGLTPVFGHSWDGGVYTGMYPRMFLESPEKEYFIRLAFHPSTIEDDLWDEAIATTNNKDMTIKWSKSATDYIELTFEDCWVIVYDADTPPPAGIIYDEVHIYPQSISVDVKDTLAGSAYGE